jgi:hypothetical protein
MRRRIATAILLGVTAIGLAGCDYMDPNGYNRPNGYERPYGYENGYGYGQGMRFGDYVYDGRDYASGYSGYSGRYGSGQQSYLRGAGVGSLDPWLASTPEGQGIVTARFGGRDGMIGYEAAQSANVWFRRYADSNRDMRLTDEEIRVALVEASRDTGYRRY